MSYVELDSAHFQVRRIDVYANDRMEFAWAKGHSGSYELDALPMSTLNNANETAMRRVLTPAIRTA